MRRFTLLCCAVAVMACGTSEEAADTAAAGGMVSAAPLAAADIQGRWNGESTMEGSDSVIVRSQLNFTGDPSTWTIMLPNREPLPLQVMFDGDSVITESAAYESVLRPGVQVSTRGVYRLQDGRLVGRITARYQTSGADSVAHLRMQATRAN